MTMREVFVASDNILSPLGPTSAENFSQLKKNISGIRQHNRNSISPYPFYAALFGEEVMPSNKSYSKFEQMLIASISDAINNCGPDVNSPQTIFILTSTKGNISLLETAAVDDELKERMTLHHSAKLIAGHFGFIHEPVVISHACISGLLGIITGMRMLQSGQYKHAVIAGADVITQFVLSGFQSFQAISPQPCKPFDAKRNGITLGEAASAIILSTDPQHASSKIKIESGSVSNDANHISGPSRTGEELCQSISRAMKDAHISEKDIDFISAHGTATLYNDEMEARAINLAHLDHVPVNSLKGYYGHTLGAAGLIESVISIYSLKENIVLPTRGFSEPGTTKNINVCNSMQTGNFRYFLKTASGFGGCNAAIVISKGS